MARFKSSEKYRFNIGGKTETHTLLVGELIRAVGISFILLFLFGISKSEEPSNGIQSTNRVRRSIADDFINEIFRKLNDLGLTGFVEDARKMLQKGILEYLTMESTIKILICFQQWNGTNIRVLDININDENPINFLRPVFEWKTFLRNLEKIVYILIFVNVITYAICFAAFFGIFKRRPTFLLPFVIYRMILAIIVVIIVLLSLMVQLKGYIGSYVDDMKRSSAVKLLGCFDIFISNTNSITVILDYIEPLFHALIVVEVLVLISNLYSAIIVFRYYKKLRQKQPIINKSSESSFIRRLKRVSSAEPLHSKLIFEE